MSLPMPREERHASATKSTDTIGIGRITKGGREMDALLLLEIPHLVEPAPTNDTNLGRTHVQVISTG